MSTTSRTGARSRPKTILLASLGALIALVAMLAIGGSQAQAAKFTVVLGKSENPPPPLCPDACRGIVSTTAYQANIPGSTTPFEVDSAGKVTKWSITLGSPTNVQRTSFNQQYGSPPQAGIAVLKLLTTKNGAPKYYLLRKSPIRALGKYFGKTVTFKLQKPLAVKPGNVVALIVPTWAPAFSVIDPQTNRNYAKYTWRGSMPSNKCNAKFASAWNPQLAVGSKRVYGCQFSGAQLLYTATVTGRD